MKTVACLYSSGARAAASLGQQPPGPVRNGAVTSPTLADTGPLVPGGLAQSHSTRTLIQAFTCTELVVVAAPRGSTAHVCVHVKRSAVVIFVIILVHKMPHTMRHWRSDYRSLMTSQRACQHHILKKNNDIVAIHYNFRKYW